MPAGAPARGVAIRIAYRAALLATPLLLLAGLTGCSDDGTAAADPALPPPVDELVPSPAANPSAQTPASTDDQPALASEPQVAATVATGLQVPWGIARLPGGALLVSERNSGRIQRIAADGSSRTMGVVPGFRPGGEGGLLGLALPPDFATRPLLYAYLTSEEDNRIIRMPYGEDALGEPEVLVSGIERSAIHNGGRMVFGPDGMLYAATGDAGDRPTSQDPASLNGKILRMTPDGGAPEDNPIAGSLVYSLGHRNVQGLAFDSRGRLWASEFGQNTFDELNLIRAGGNYGWPLVEGFGQDERFIDPERVWPTAEASPSGIAIANGSIWMAALRGSRLWEIPLTGPGAATPTAEPRAWFVEEFGRLRTVLSLGADTLLLATSNTDGRGRVRSGDDRIVRLTIP